MEAPLRVAQAFMQHLVLLLSALRQRFQEFRLIQSVVLPASKRHEKTQDVQQQLTSQVVAAAIAKEISRASYYEERGRPVPAKLPLRLNMNEANITDLVGESVAAISIWKCVHQSCRVGNKKPLSSCKVLWNICASPNCLKSC